MSMNPSELMAHADFIRNLARSLVKDEHSAADVSQDTWVAALSHPPRTGGHVKAWLAAVTRNFARRLRRDESRRRLKDEQLVPADPVPSTEEILIREEARRRDPGQAGRRAGPGVRRLAAGP